MIGNDLNASLIGNACCGKRKEFEKEAVLVSDWFEKWKERNE